jgi:hypothetical protein
MLDQTVRAVDSESRNPIEDFEKFMLSKYRGRYGPKTPILAYIKK